MRQSNTTFRNSLVAGAILLILSLVLFSYSGPSSRVSHKVAALTGGKFGSSGLEDIANRTLGFQRIIAINLPSRTDHKDSLSLAAHFSGLDITYADGVTEVAEKALPPGAEKFTTKGGLNAWRAHMNVLRNIINRDVSTALIMEDDADWDIRIKSQLNTFARASRRLTSAIAAGDVTRSFQAQLPDLRGFDQRGERSYSSPYGNVDEWDVFWLGHCGQKLVPAEEEGRAVIYNDETVAESQHLHGFYGDSPTGAEYPNHTRVVTRGHWGLCTIAYAVTNRGAQKLLYELSVRNADKAFDILLEELCDGTRGRPRLTCLTVLPQLFSTHRPIAPKSSFSNIDLADPNTPIEYSSVAYTENIRLSTKGNLEALIYDTGYTDLLMDGQPRLDPNA